MAHSYTPGLRVTPLTKLQRRRILPLKGEVLVSVGDNVERSGIVAKTDLPGDVTSVNVVNRLGIEPSEIERYMLVRPGDEVDADTIIAETRPFIKWFKSTVKSPVKGRIENVSNITGQVIIRHPPRPVSVTAYVDGTVVEVVPEEGVVVETQGAFVQGIFGVGGETWGEIEVISRTPDELVKPDDLKGDHSGKILIAGSLATKALIQAAIKAKAAGLITGGINAGDLREMLGYDLGVAITGTEELGITIIVTEGFGEIGMAHRTFEILKGCAGKRASINGATQIRAGVMRPEIIAQTDRTTEDVGSGGHGGGLEIGDTIRVIREPYFGRLGKVAGLPAELTKVESETKVRVLDVAFDGGETVTVPRANVESITL